MNEVRGITVGAKLTLLVLASHADANGRCFVKIDVNERKEKASEEARAKTLRAKVGCSRSAVFNYLDELERGGLIARTSYLRPGKGGQGASTYQLTLRRPESAPRQGVQNLDGGKESDIWTPEPVLETRPTTTSARPSAEHEGFDDLFEKSGLTGKTRAESLRRWLQEDGYANLCTSIVEEWRYQRRLFDEGIRDKDRPVDTNLLAWMLSPANERHYGPHCIGCYVPLDAELEQEARDFLGDEYRPLCGDCRGRFD